MTASTGRTLAFTVLIIAFLLLAVRLTPLILAPLGIFPGMARIIHGTVPDVSGVRLVPHWFAGWGVASVLTLSLLVLWIGVIVWVYRDAERRNMNGVLWALLVFFGNLIGLLIYLIVRSDSRPAAQAQPKDAGAPCPSCQKPAAGGYAYCPHCGATLRTVCPNCAKPVEKDWKACPHCGKRL